MTIAVDWHVKQTKQTSGGVFHLLLGYPPYLTHQFLRVALFDG